MCRDAPAQAPARSAETTCLTHAVLKLRLRLRSRLFNIDD